MILDGRQRMLVLAGRKTMHRLDVGEPREVKRKNGRPPYIAQPFRPRPGLQIPVQPGVGRPASFHVIVQDVRFEMLGAITFHDARAEGHRTTVEFKEAWLRANDVVWMTAGERVEDEVVARFHRRFDGTPVWAVSFAVDQADTEQRWLAPAGRPAPTSHAESLEAHGYTRTAAQAVRDAGEAIHPELAEFYAQDGHERHLARPGRREQLIRKRVKTLQGRIHRLAAAGASDDLAVELDRLEAQLELLEQQRRAA